MIHSREIFPTSLDHALLANRVVLALDEIRDGRDAPNKGEALRDAVDFLQFIVKGRNLTKNREISENSYQAALAYGEAIRAIEQLPAGVAEKDGDSGRVLQNLLSFALALEKDLPVNRPQLDALSTFFKLVREITLSAESRRTEVVRFIE